MRLKRPRLQLGVILDPDEPGMNIARILDGFWQQPVGAHAGKDQPGLFQPFLVVDVHLVAVAVALGHLGLAVDFGNHCALFEGMRIGAEPHRATHVA